MDKRMTLLQGVLALAVVCLCAGVVFAQQGSKPKEKQEFRPSPIPTDLKMEAEKVFGQGMPYFIWSDKKGTLQSKGSGTILEVGLRFAVNPQKTGQPLMTRIKLTAKDSQGREIELSNHATGAAVSESKKTDASVIYANVFLIFASLKGQGIGAIDLIAAGAEDPAKANPISNRISVGLMFE